MFLSDGPCAFRDIQVAFPEVFERLRKAGVELFRDRQACTGVSASWCPVCGDCLCRNPADKNDDGCPLHDASSPHAEYEV